MKKRALIVIMVCLIAASLSCNSEVETQKQEWEQTLHYKVQYEFNSAIYTCYTDEVSFYGGSVSFDERTIGGNWIVDDLWKRDGK